MNLNIKFSSKQEEATDRLKMLLSLFNVDAQEREMFMQKFSSKKSGSFWGFFKKWGAPVGIVNINISECICIDIYFV